MKISSSFRIWGLVMAAYLVEASCRQSGSSADKKDLERTSSDTDNVAESSSNSPGVTSYSSVVIHHPATKSESKPPRSEAYFRVVSPPGSRYLPRISSQVGIQEVDPPRALHAPKGMTPELMSTLLKQEPQTFESEQEAIGIELRKTKKYSGGEKKRTHKEKQGTAGGHQEFNVGYSIGFGGAAARMPQPQALRQVQEVVVGKPKSGITSSRPMRIHVEGMNSVWKELEPGVEMSQDVGARHEPPPSYRTSGGLIYVNDGHPRLAAPQQPSQQNFDHAHALGQSNHFDFTNAMDAPVPILDYAFPKAKALPLFNTPAPVYKPVPSPPVMSAPIYNGYSSFYGNPFDLGTPLPVQTVYFPGAKPGEGRMVQAIVIPLAQIQGINYNSLDFQQPNLAPQHLVQADLHQQRPIPQPQEHQPVRQTGSYTTKTRYPPKEAPEQRPAKGSRVEMIQALMAQDAFRKTAQRSVYPGHILLRPHY